MSIIDTLITDRTAADTAALEALFAKAKAGTLTDEEWAVLAEPAHRGAYNYTDLNRVNSAMEYLVSRLRGYGYAVKGYERDNTVWTMASIPHLVQMNRYVDNVAAIRRALAMLPTTPAAPADMENLTAEEANAIEQILVDCEMVINAMLPVMPRAAQPLVMCGFVIYAAHPEIEAPDMGYLAVYTADGLAVYTSDGLPVFVSAETIQLRVYTADGLAVYTADSNPVYVMS